MLVLINVGSGLDVPISSQIHENETRYQIFTRPNLQDLRGRAYALEYPSWRLPVHALLRVATAGLGFIGAGGLKECSCLPAATGPISFS